MGRFGQTMQKYCEGTTMKAQTPAKNTAMMAEYKDMVGFRTICECTSDHHSVDTWIEVNAINDDMDEITVTFYINTYQHPFAWNFWQRVKNAFMILIGVDQRSQEIILKRQQAINWCKAVENTVNKLDKKLKELENEEN